MFTNIFDSTNKCVFMIGMHCPYHIGGNALKYLLVTVGGIGICTYAQQGSFNGYRLCRSITVRCTNTVPQLKWCTPALTVPYDMSVMLCGYRKHVNISAIIKKIVKMVYRRPNCGARISKQSNMW